MVHELERGLSGAGHDVTLFATGDSRGADVRFAFPSPVWPPDPRAEAVHCAHAARTIARERFDVVHAHAQAMLGFADELEAPLVFTLHGVHDAALTRECLRHPTVRCVAISERQAQLEPGLACDVVHHGLDPEAYPLGRGEGDYAAFLGRLAPCKGPELAVAAARAAGAPLKLAGEVHLVDATPAWTATLARALAQPGVTHVGPLGGERKVRFLGAARALLMPIRWEEPFGLAMIEAMLCGTPVIGFPRGSAPEVVDEGVTGFLVEDVDEMAAVLPRLTRFDREACRRRAQVRFSTRRMVHDYERAYERAVAAAGRLRGRAEESTYAP